MKQPSTSPVYRIIVLVPTMLFFCFFLKTHATEISKETRNLDKWLQVGPFEEHLPAFHKTAGKEFSAKNLLDFNEIDVSKLVPGENKSFLSQKPKKPQWTSVTADTAGLVFPIDTTRKQPRVLYLAGYLNARRWSKAMLELSSPQLFRCFLDGEEIGKKTALSKKNAEKNSVSKEIKLETGKHLLVVKLLWNPGSSQNWRFQAKLQFSEPFHRSDIENSISPLHRMNIRHLLDDPAVGNISISPQGKYATVSVRRALPPGDDSESWLELWRVKDGRLLQTFRGGMKIGSVQWAPTGERFSYTSSEKEKNTLWVVDLKNGTTTALLENIKNLDSYTWSPDGHFIVYGITEKPEKEKKPVKRLSSPRDRWPTWRNRSFLYRVEYPAGKRQRLTAGRLTTTLQAIRPDGRLLLFSREIEDYRERPYGKTQLFTMNLQSFEVDSIWEGTWFGDARWSPDGKKLLLLGGPSMFGKLGQNVPEGKLPNEYDQQAYLMDFGSKNVQPLTKHFAPSIRSAIWNDPGTIYFSTIDHSYRTLYQYDLKSGTFTRVESGVEVLNNVRIARNKPIAIYTGSGAASPKKAYLLDLKKKKYRLLSDPAAKSFKNVRFGKVEKWNFQNERGTTIEGRIYYPPDFKPSEKYPCIVYYYGGTSPVGRDFAGRYPKNYWAANGYVVYVLQPSGATGFGQAFSSLHVNDWGKIVADEIINGVSQFLAAHPFIDRDRVGAIGASYGGFMTELLLTKTDIFAAAVSHAGISSISSYWGEGYWGFLYSAVATANSFPWNRKDIYVDQSALFSADKINTPLLLLHGTDDTNVPPGESIQLYTALKLLGKTVEHIRVQGQNHLIMTYSRRKIWTRTIVAWFDRWLKNQPEWWNDLYPAK